MCIFQNVFISPSNYKPALLVALIYEVSTVALLFYPPITCSRPPKLSFSIQHMSGECQILSKTLDNPISAKSQIGNTA